MTIMGICLAESQFAPANDPAIMAQERRVRQGVSTHDRYWLSEMICAAPQQRELASRVAEAVVEVVHAEGLRIGADQRTVFESAVFRLIANAQRGAA